jgi:two-component system sensor histidine kinase UhpB
VDILENTGGIQLVISDSGKGFDMDTAMRGRGLGLTSMQERVWMLNGTIDIKTKPMAGTTIDVRIPFPADAREK